MVIEKLVVKTGSACSLRCAKCGEFNPYLEKANRKFCLTAEELSRDIFCILSAIDRVNVIHVAGGEPFLHKDLFLLLSCLSFASNVGTIEVVTNGTVLIDEITLHCLSCLREKVLVIISNYSSAGIDNKEFLFQLNQVQVNYRLNNNLIWKDKSDISFKRLGHDELVNTAERCTSFRSDYFSLINGVVTAHCPTSGSILHYLELYENAEGHYIDIRKSPVDSLAKDLERLSKTKYTPLCNWCVPTCDAVDCIAGVQLN